MEWLQYLSWFNYANEALSINQWQDVSFIDCHNSSACPNNGAAILRSLNYDVVSTADGRVGTVGKDGRWNRQY